MNTTVRPLHVLMKAMALFILINVLYAVTEPSVYKLSLYNIIFPGRARLPFSNGNNPYVITIDDADAMLAVHSIAGKKTANEIRVAFIGDSSVWGEDLSFRDALPGQLNQLALQCKGKTIKAYNLGYPHPSVLKDLILIKKTKDHQPDLIVWLITLNTVASHRVNPFLIANREDAMQLLENYDIPFTSVDALAESDDDFYKKTILGQRSYLARLIKLQALGALWLTTEKDMSVLADEPADLSPDVKEDVEYRQLTPGANLGDLLLLDALFAGYDLVGDTPVLLINEPMYIATGLHSDVRYNDFYPRWAYDQYRAMIAEQAQQHSWKYVDLWNAIPNEYFVGTALHLSARGERLLAEHIQSTIHSMVCN